MGALGTQAPASLERVLWAWVPRALQGQRHAEVDSGQNTWPDASLGAREVIPAPRPGTRPPGIAKAITITITLNITITIILLLLRPSAEVSSPRMRGRQTAAGVGFEGPRGPPRAPQSHPAAPLIEG